MPYTTQASVAGKIPQPLLNDALDDNRDGVADAGLLDQIIADCSRDVDGFLSGTYQVPFPSLVIVTSTSRARGNNVATVTTAAPHNLTDGQVVGLSGLSGVGYNLEAAGVSLQDPAVGDEVPAVITPNSFNYACVGPDEPATPDNGGVITLGGPPAAVQAATLVLVIEAIYDRRPTGDKNPWRGKADWWRARLQKIGNRELPLDSTFSGDPITSSAVGSAAPVPGRLAT